MRDGGRALRSSVLDHGYVDLVETWGDDESIIEAICDGIDEEGDTT